MIPTKYVEQLKVLLRNYFPATDHKIFIFGSALKHKHFADIDVGILGPVEASKLNHAAETLRNSNFPFIVDLVDFSQTQEPFKSSVLNQQSKRWI